ncbi:MAG: metal-dependent hydrolase [Pirellulaceae bacterium]|nr:MAG: metal-dependent hydrolase [Pirellulaceae bacterium]
MLDNSPILTHQHGTWTIEGYSRAAVQTYYRIPELRIAFDVGAHPWDFMGTPTLAITHSHLDHIAALPLYIARRRMMKMEPPKVFLPEHALRPVESMLRIVSRLDRGRLPCELIPVRPGDEFELSRELVLRVYPTRHTVPSVGYIVWERRNKLKEEYRDLSGPEIRDLRLSGIEITRETRFPIIGYTGDTSPRGLDDNPDMYEAKVLVTEMTFIASKHRKDKIHKHGHMHLDDFVERRDAFHNELIIAGHLSMRYTAAQVERLVRRRLTDMLDGRLKLWI